MASCSEKTFQFNYAALCSMSDALTGKWNLPLPTRGQALFSITAP